MTNAQQAWQEVQRIGALKLALRQSFPMDRELLKELRAENAKIDKLLQIVFPQKQIIRV